MTDFGALVAQAGAITTAVIVIVKVIKEMGVPGRFMSALAVVSGIGLSYLTVSHDPSVFILLGILAAGVEKGAYSIDEKHIENKMKEELAGGDADVTIDADHVDVNENES